MPLEDSIPPVSPVTWRYVCINVLDINRVWLQNFNLDVKVPEPTSNYRWCWVANFGPSLMDNFCCQDFFAARKQQAPRGLKRSHGNWKMLVQEKCSHRNTVMIWFAPYSNPQPTSKYTKIARKRILIPSIFIIFEYNIYNIYIIIYTYSGRAGYHALPACWLYFSVSENQKILLSRTVNWNLIKIAGRVVDRHVVTQIEIKRKTCRPIGFFLHFWWQIDRPDNKIG